MSDGSNVMAEVEYNDSTFTYHLTFPLTVGSMSTANGEVTTSVPYLPGASSNTVIIPSTFIVTLSEVDDFYRRFYGSSLMRFYMQSIMRKASLSGSTELDTSAVSELSLMREEIEEKYGTISEDISAIKTTKERTLH